MKKIILLIVISIVGVINATAQISNFSQSNDLKECVNTLSIKLNSLQHDYDILYCNYILSDVQLNLKDFMNDLNTRANAILINCYNGRFDFDLYYAYNSSYNSSLELYDSMKERTESTKALVTLKIQTSNFTDDEIKLLRQSCKLVDDCLTSAQSSLNYIKVVLDMYKSVK